MKQPNFFIVGAPKSGTSAMAQYLSEHSQVFMSNPKEPHHFNSDQTHGSFKDRSVYSALFEGASQHHRRVGEASVWYLYSETAIPNIEAELLDAKYIIMLRNPVTMAPSLHEQQVFTGHENHAEFEAAWRAQDARRAGRDVPAICSDAKLLLYKEACSLGTQLSRLYDRVDRDRVLCLFNDDFRADPRRVWLDVQAFLDLDDDGRTVFPVVNAAKERKLRFLRYCSNKYGQLCRRLNLSPMGTGVLTMLNQWNMRTRPRSPLSSELSAELQEAFAPEIGLLEKLTDRNLSDWKLSH